MLFLDHTQVQYCKLKDKDKLISGLIYNGNVFVRAKAFPREELEAAIKECREEYLDHKERSQIATLLVKDTTSVGIWMHNQNYKPEDATLISKTENTPTASNIASKTPIDTNRISVRQLGSEMRSDQGVEIKTRRYKLKLYQRCFLGNEAVDWIVQRVQVPRKDAVILAQKMLEKGIIHHVLDEHQFKDEGLFYRFKDDDGKSIWNSNI